MTSEGCGSTGSTKISIVPLLGHMLETKRTPSRVSPGLTPSSASKIFRLHRDHARLAVGERLARRLQHRTAGAAAADPARHDGAVRPDDGLGAGLGRGHRHRAHDGGEHEGFFGGLHLRNQIHHLDMLAHHSLARYGSSAVRLCSVLAGA